MSADKRTVHTDALETLGTIIGPVEKRDAIHIAVEPVTAGMQLEPGADVGFLDNGQVGHGPDVKNLGIVDPFLKAPVEKGQMFWLLVYPREIRSLRHVWSHPAFKDEVTDGGLSEASREWMESWAAEHDISYDQAISAGKDYVRYGSYLVDGGKFEGSYVPDEYWPHFERITGIMVPSGERGSFFSCSC